MNPIVTSDSPSPSGRWKRYAHAGYWMHWLRRKGQQLIQLCDGQHRLRKETKKARNLAIQHFRHGEPEKAIALYIDAVRKRVERISEPRESILLTGPVRIGKSTIARTVAQSGGYFHAEIDHFLFDRSQQIDREYLVKFGRDLCRALIHNFPDGVLVDAAYEQATSDVMSREFLLRIKNEIRVFIAGCGAENPEIRMAAVMEYRKFRSCWTNSEALTRDAIREVCDEIYRTTLLLKDFSHEHGLPYLSIGADKPEADIRIASGKLLSAVRRN